MAFIVPPSTTTCFRKALVAPPRAILHPVYDVASVSTYVAYSLAKYWIGEEERLDVEMFGYLMAVLWKVTTAHDPTVFLFLWLIGGVSEFVSGSFFAGGNWVEAERFRVGVRMGGYMSFALLVFDLLDVASGY